MISNNKISNLIASQVPFFVRNDHENFVAFLEAYYEFLEQETGVINVSRNMLQQADIDKTDLFIQKFYDNFIPLIPDSSVADRTMILKKIKDFYRSRGTEKSIRFLMRVLFDEEVEFYYPQKDILKVSDGKWFVEKSLKVTDVRIDGVANDSIGVTQNFVGRKITGLTSNAYALVERTAVSYDAGSLVRELKLSNQYKEFQSGEQITATFIDQGTERTLTANLFSGGINEVKLVNSGSGYVVGDEVKIEGGGGSGALIIVSSVSTGGLSGIATLDGGAGFQVGNQVVIDGGGGTGANANVFTVISDGSYHPNTYNIVSSIIALEANTRINNTRYANMNTTHVVSRTTPIANAVSYFRYSNTGPIETVLLFNLGQNYSTKPSFSAFANTRVRRLGILGKMKIVDGGTGYQPGDTITFTNVIGGYGTGAAARVKSVDAAAGNTITAVEFVPTTGHITGGAGYEQATLPIATVNSVEGTGANILVTSVLGSGEILTSIGTTQGAIERLTLVSRGSGYTSAPTLNLKASGDGTALATASIITGAFSYPGRYLNDDGHISSYNFIQNRDYYQKYSYVIKLKQSIEKYRTVLKNLIHPAGMKLFGEYMVVDNGETLNATFRNVSETIVTTTQQTYSLNVGVVTIVYPDHGLQAGNTVYLDWITGNVATSNANTKGPFEVLPVTETYLFNINTNAYLANTQLANTTGIVNVGKVIY